MPASTPAGLPYPLDHEPFADMAQAIKLLAEAIVPTIPMELLNTPHVDLTLAANWSAASVRATKLLGGSFLWLEANVTRAAGAAVMTAGATGNYTDTDMVKLPTRWTPARRQYLTGNRSSLAQYQLHLHSDGWLTVDAAYPGATISPGDVITVQQLLCLVS